MLSYPIAEADELLTTRLATAKQNLTNCEEDLDFLREQITVSAHISANEHCPLAYRDETDNRQTMEVATARVYNWDVTMKRKEKQEQEALESGGKDGSPNG